MSEDWEFEETLRRLAGPVDRGGVWAKIETGAGVEPWAIGDGGGVATGDGAPTQARKFNLRVALYVSLTAVIVAAITVGSLEAVKHLGNDHSILVITDDPTGITPGLTGQIPQDPDSQPSAAMFRGNPARTGVYPSGGPVDTPGLLWKFKTGEREGSSPVVSEGTVYVGGSDWYLYALDALSGQEKWKFLADYGLTSSPAISDGVVYFGSYQGYLYALDAQSGQEKWKFRTSDASDRNRIESSPAVSDGVVYFGTDSGYLFALDAASGQLKWKFRAGDGEGYDAVSSSPAISEGVVYFGDTQGSLYALDAQSGQEKWSSRPAEAYGWSSPAVSGGVVYFANTGTEPNLYGSDFYYGYLHALDAQTGQEKWMYKADGAIRSSPAVSGGVVCFLHDADDWQGVAVAVDTATGKELWKFKTANDWGWGIGIGPSLSISGEVAYFVAAEDNGHLYALDTTTGEMLWTWSFPFVGASPGGVASSPIISGGAVYFSGSDGYLYVLR